MKYYCKECGWIFEEDHAAFRLAEPEDGQPRGTKVMVCPDCGSSAIDEAQDHNCGNCVWRAEFAEDKTLRCGNKDSDWYHEETCELYCCGEWRTEECD